ncbi:hypothetical protein HanPI659440_Chr14g0572061 [Helianthus annuus]|nr:hypothetical protein HanPI659440_Chr14g0572061 [Helianthus annuus]
MSYPQNPPIPPHQILAFTNLSAPNGVVSSKSYFRLIIFFFNSRPYYVLNLVSVIQPASGFEDVEDEVSPKMTDCYIAVPTIAKEVHPFADEVDAMIQMKVLLAF